MSCKLDKFTHVKRFGSILKLSAIYGFVKTKIQVCRYFFL